jgi:hypothetical protein
LLPKLNVITERLQTGWRSAVYGFFEAKVTVGYDDHRKYHFFKCAAKKCKGKSQKGVRRYQDSKDCAATSNLKSHAVKCFGGDAVDAAFENAEFGGRDGSIFAAFARQGQQPVKVSHRTHTSEESRSGLYFDFLHLLMEVSGHILRGGAPKAIACTILSRTANLKLS